MLKRKFNFAGAVLAACAVLVGGASAASAAPATFNLTGSGGAQAQGTWTITNAVPNQTLTCPATTAFALQNLANTGSPLQGTFNPAVIPWQSCSGWGIELMPQPFVASSNAGAYSVSSGRMIVRVGGSQVSTAATVAVQAAWTNGSGSTPSTFTFNNAPVAISSINGQPIRITGTFRATHASGLLLLS